MDLPQCPDCARGLERVMSSLSGRESLVQRNCNARGAGSFAEPTSLLLKDPRRATDSLALEVHDDLNTVRNFDERNAAVHPIVLTVERHGAGNFALAGPFAANCKNQLFRLGHTANREVAVELNRVGTGLCDLRRVKSDQ